MSKFSQDWVAISRDIAKYDYDVDVTFKDSPSKLQTIIHTKPTTSNTSPTKVNQ